LWWVLSYHQDIHTQIIQGCLRFYTHPNLDHLEYFFDSPSQVNRGRYVFRFCAAVSKFLKNSSTDLARDSFAAYANPYVAAPLIAGAPRTAMVLSVSIPSI
jgi:hypothetical protein